MCRDPIVKAYDRHDVKPHCVLFTYIVQCAYFWPPLGHEFFDVCKAAVVFYLSRFGTGQNGEDGCVPSRGVDTPEGFNDGCGLSFGGGVALRPLFSSRFEVKNDAGALPVCRLGGGGWDVT